MRDVLVETTVLPRAVEVAVEFDGAIIEHHLLRVGSPGQVAITLPGEPGALQLRAGELIAVRDEAGAWLPFLAEQHLHLQRRLVSVHARSIDPPEQVATSPVPWRRRLGLAALSTLVALFVMPPLFAFVLAFGWGARHPAATSSLALSADFDTLRVHLVPKGVDGARVDRTAAHRTPSATPSTTPKAQPMQEQAQAVSQPQAPRPDPSEKDAASAEAVAASDSTAARAQTVHRELDAGATSTQTSTATTTQTSTATATARAVLSGTRQATETTAAVDDAFARLMNQPALDPAAVGALHQIKDASASDAMAASAAGAPAGAPTSARAGSASETGDARATATGTASSNGHGSGSGEDTVCSGGLGLEGVGAGGDAFGTIGLGDIGTIGHGSGSGDGYGYGSGQLGDRVAAGPICTLGTTEVSGGLDKEIIRRVVRAHLNEVRHCYERELQLHPKLAGRVSTAFHIDASGAVSSSLATAEQGLAGANVGPRVAACVQEAVARWTFPRLEKGGSSVVSYPFYFSVSE